MPQKAFRKILSRELQRIDSANSAKRNERIITGFTNHPNPRACIDGEEFVIWNSNDYLGLRHHVTLKRAEAAATETYGTGPGAVRFISGTCNVYKDLERAIAQFHKREDAMVFSSAFAANLAVIASVTKGQSKNSLVDDSTLVLSDALNHRSLIEGIRVAGLSKDNVHVYNHLDIQHISQLLEQHAGTFVRVWILTDGVFSMLGEVIPLNRMRDATNRFQDAYEQGVWILVDDSHGVGAVGKTGRGVEEVTGAHADILVGTLGKGFGCDGGYIAGEKVLIEYLRESASTYIYSNPMSPGAAGAALEAIRLVDSEEGISLLESLGENIAYFKQCAADLSVPLAADAIHPVQPVFIGDPAKAVALREYLYTHKALVSAITYPVVAAGADEIRIQISALHDRGEIDILLNAIKNFLLAYPSKTE